MLTFWAASRSAVGRRFAGRGEGVPRGFGGVGCVVGRSRSVVAVGGALASGVPGDGPAGVDRGAAHDRAGELRAADGAQAALPVGAPDVGGGGPGSIHLRRFCRISLSERVPDESTVRKLTRRIGAETVAEMTRALIVKATREKRFRLRGR